MTIKQQGGIFGRNPTFNDVDVDNDLTVSNNLIVDNKLGVGTTSPSQVIHAVNPSTSYVLSETTGSGTSAGFRLKGDASADFTLFTTQGVNQFGIYDNGNAAQRFTIDESGNVGIGITPSAWRSNETVIQLPDAAFYAGNNYASFGQNYYIPAGGGARYIEDGAASDYYQAVGQHVFRVAASGTAEGTISWTTAATITSSGNLAFPSGQGIDFSATSGTGTSELFDDYEEGTWTPAGNGVTLTSASGHYTKVGRLVHVHCQITFPTNSDTNNANIYGLPYTVGQQSTGHIGYNNFGSGTNKYFAAFSAGTHLRLYDDNGNNSTNATFSGKNVWITTTYGV